jgi:rhodanese-related sulfurtransferase
MLFGRKITALPPTETWEAHNRKLPRRIDELPRENTIAFLCRSGHRSILAARQARRHGIDVLSVKGGMIAWNKAGLPTSTPPRHDSQST